MLTSGPTAKVTIDDNPVTLLTISSGYYVDITVVNEGTVAGFFSTDGGTSWGRLPAGPSSVTVRSGGGTGAVMVKRVVGGTDLTGLWAFAA